MVKLRQKLVSALLLLLPGSRADCLLHCVRRQTFARAAAANDVELAARELFPDKCAPQPEPETEAKPAPEAEPQPKPEHPTAAEPMQTEESTPALQQNGTADTEADVSAEDAVGSMDADNAAAAEPAGLASVAEEEMPAP